MNFYLVLMLLLLLLKVNPFWSHRANIPIEAIDLTLSGYGYTLKTIGKTRRSSALKPYSVCHKAIDKGYLPIANGITKTYRSRLCFVIKSVKDNDGKRFWIS